MSSVGLIISFMLIAWFLVAIYVADDASSRNKNAIAWFLFTLIFGIVALLIYTISVTPSRGGTKTRGNNTNGIRTKTNDSDWKGSSRSKKQPFWKHKLERHNFNDEPIFKVTDSKNHAKFVVREDEIVPHSEVYQRKYGTKWIDDARSYLEKEMNES